MKEVIVTAVRSDGLRFDYESEEWKITSLDGIDFPPVEIFKKPRGFGHGDIVTGKRKSSRVIDIIAESQMRQQNEADRRWALAFHNANYTYDVLLTYMGTVRTAKGCYLDGAKCPSGNVYARQQLTVSYLVPDADLYGDSNVNTRFENVSPLWHVTRAYPPGGSLPFSVINLTTSKTIEYLGSEPAPVTVTVKALGYVENINITINDVTVHIEHDFTEGDVLILDSETKDVTLNGEKMSELLYDSIALPDLLMIYGFNLLKIEADDPGNMAFTAEVDYVGRYGGL